jgi:GGDEF domain-containing protein
MVRHAEHLVDAVNTPRHGIKVLGEILESLRSGEPQWETLLRSFGEWSEAYCALLFLLEVDPAGRVVCRDQASWWDRHCPAHAQDLFARTAFVLDDYGFLAKTVNEGAIFTGLAHDLPAREYGLFSALGAGGMTLLPLAGASDTPGFIVLFMRIGVRAWIPEDLAIARAVAALLAESVALSRARADKRVAEQRMLALAQGGYDWVLSFDSGGSISYAWVNPKAGRLFQRDIATGAHLGEALPREAAQALLRVGPRVLAASEPEAIEFAMPGNNGIRHFAARVFSLPCERRGCREIFALARETTSEKNCGLRGELMHAGMDLLSEAMLLLDPEFRVVAANPVAGEIADAADGGPVGKAFEELVHPVDVSLVRDVTEGLRHRDESRVLRFRMQRREGGERWVEGRFKARRTSGGYLTGVALVLADLSHVYRAAPEQPSLYDPVTRLPGVQLFTSALRQVVAQARRKNRRLGLGAIRCAQIREYASHLGRRAADCALAHFAEKLRTALRASDMMCRWEADVFLVLLPELDEDGQAVVCRLQQVVAAGVDIDGVVLHPVFECRLARFPDEATDDAGLIRSVLSGLNGGLPPSHPAAPANSILLPSGASATAIAGLP